MHVFIKKLEHERREKCLKRRVLEIFSACDVMHRLRYICGGSGVHDWDGICEALDCKELGPRRAEQAEHCHLRVVYRVG